MHGALLGNDGSPAPIFAEVERLGAEIALAERNLCDTTPDAPIAMLYSYPSR